MAGKAGTVYIKADRNVEVAKTSVMIGDVLKIECTEPGNACQESRSIQSADLSPSG